MKTRDIRTLSFTPAEVRRIEKAARICDWKSGESASFSRAVLLRNITAILKGARETPDRRWAGHSTTRRGNS